MRTSPVAALPLPLASALEAHGFTSLMPVQTAVLDAALAGRDLRIASKTGSGKTVALGLVLARELAELRADDELDVRARRARPRALVVTPTRELAAQVAGELAWLLAAVDASVTTVTGGTNLRDERRALGKGATIVVGTPGRLRDHLGAGAIDASRVATVVLDEADQMLDLGFREDLEAILGETPETRHTHLVSATFSRDALALADEFQREPVSVDGTRPGGANDDIAHVAHLVRHDERNAALVNLLLLAPKERTLVFVRTRADASAVADGLASVGFAARPLSGELEQDERTRTLEAFRQGAVEILVATDVAARGLDVADVSRVIHADPPGDAEALTHRSGRTGRAGRKGTAIVLVPPAMRELVGRLYRHARIEPTWAPVPTQLEVERAADERFTREVGADSGEIDARFYALTDRLLGLREPRELVAALLARLDQGLPRARPVTPMMPPQAERRPAPGRRPPLSPAARARRDGAAPTSFTLFRITWGSQHGADARRLLAVVCRRGGIEGNQVGAIRVAEQWSTFQVGAEVAEEFGRAAAKPDPRAPRVRIERWLSPDERAPRRPRVPAPVRAPRPDAPRPAAAGKAPGKRREPKQR